ncbi:MAG: class I SAM-dependent methyltransferase [Candidatus Ancillula sp.]|jgi:SAM-dependent methyltransferase|nr:class I SAM-dependent methyltransferase [Candidatus Ancillula sp.]
MNKVAAEFLANLNNEFYNNNAQSFASTRKTAWTGWDLGMQIISKDMKNQQLNAHLNSSFYLNLNHKITTQDTESMLNTPDQQISAHNSIPFQILDIAAGNLRFEQFVRNKYPDLCSKFTAIDHSQELFDSSEFMNDDVEFIREDVVEKILYGQKICSKKADLVACFGFMHHVPGFDNRKQFFNQLAEITRPGGYLFVSFWGFANTEPGLKKAHNFTAEFMAYDDLYKAHCCNLTEELEHDDYFLGWKNNGTYRYCHNFQDEEIDQLKFALEVNGQFTLIKKYKADGKSGAENTYLVMRRNSAY